MTVTGPDFISLQVDDLERAAAFYADTIGIPRAAVSPPHAVVFDTRPIAFAVRDAVPGAQLDPAMAGRGVALWFHDPEGRALHARLVDAGSRSLPSRSTARSASRSASPTRTATASPCTTGCRPPERAGRQPCSSDPSAASTFFSPASTGNGNRFCFGGSGQLKA